MPEQFKKMALLCPRAGLSEASFRRHWREVHGPLVASSPGYGAYRHRYVQNHIIAPGPIGGPMGYAGMAEFWLPSDNEDDFATTAIYKDRIRVDELRFIDMERTVSMSALETVVKPGRGPVKLVVLSRRHPDLPLAEFHRALATRHVPALLDTPAVANRLCAWSLNPIIEGSFRLPGGRMTEALPIDCIEELWFKSRKDALAAFAPHDSLQRTRQVTEQLFAKEGRQSFLAEEHVFFDAGQQVDPPFVAPA